MQALRLLRFSAFLLAGSLLPFSGLVPLGVPGALAAPVPIPPVPPSCKDLYDPLDSAETFDCVGETEAEFLAHLDPLCVLPTDVGHGDAVTLWTPLFVVNSPYQGTTTKTEEASASIQFKFGTHWVAINQEEARGTEIALTAEEGRSFGYYRLLTWEHQKYGTCNGSVDYWRVSDYQPNGYRQWRVFELTGASRWNDRDNLLEPRVGGEDAAYGAMEIWTRFVQKQDEFCSVANGSPTRFTFSSSGVFYDVGVSFEFQGIVWGTSVAQLQAGSYTFTMPAGHCYGVDWLEGEWGQPAFDWEGLYQLDPRIHVLRWVNPKRVGCDALDRVEEILGEREVSPYEIHFKSQEANEGFLEASFDISELKGNVDYDNFKRVKQGDHRFRVEFEGLPAPFAFESRVKFKVDYEYDEWWKAIPFSLVAANYDWDFVGQSTPEGFQVALLRTTAPPDEVAQLSATVTPDLLAVEGGNLGAAVGHLFLRDPGEAVSGLNVLCPHLANVANDTAPYLLYQPQPWFAKGEVAFGDVFGDRALDRHHVKVYLDLAYV